MSHVKLNQKYEFKLVEGTLELVPVDQPPTRHLTESQWSALEKAERPYYTNGGGGHAYTDVMGREDDDGFVHAIWWQCQSGVEMLDGPGLPDHVIEARTAKRVAQTFALMSFGTEILFI